MSNYYKIDLRFNDGETYLFEGEGKSILKKYIGKNEKGLLMFDHIDETRRSLVDAERVPKPLKITKYK